MTPYHTYPFKKGTLFIGRLKLHTLFTHLWHTSSLKIDPKHWFLPFFAHYLNSWPLLQSARQCCQCENPTLSVIFLLTDDNMFLGRVPPLPSYQQKEHDTSLTIVCSKISLNAEFSICGLLKCECCVKNHNFLVDSKSWMKHKPSTRRNFFVKVAPGSQDFTWTNFGRTSSNI